MPVVTLSLSEHAAMILGRLEEATGLTADEVVAHAVQRWANDRLPAVTAERFRGILAKIPDVPPMPGDELE